MSALAVRQFCRQSEAFASRLPTPRRPADWSLGASVADQHHCAYLLIDLLDLWGRFCRSVILDLSTGVAKDFSGLLVANPAPLSITAALARVVNRQGHEPKWYKARDCVEAIAKLRPPLAINVSGALGWALSPVPSLLATRNYFAHRRTDCRETLERSTFYVRDMKFCPFMISNYLLPTSKTVYRSWVDDLQSMAVACLR